MNVPKTPVNVPITHYVQGRLGPTLGGEARATVTLGGIMARRIRLVLAVAVAAIAIGASACADVTGPRGDVSDCIQGQHSERC